MQSGFKVEIYEKEDGTSPFLDFIDDNPLLRSKILRDLDVLERFGNRLREPYTKSIGGGLFEMRTIFGSNYSRTFYFFFVGRRIIITHAFLKKTKKTPQDEIDRAMKYRSDWLRRNGDETK